MRIVRIIWLPEIVDKLASKHGVAPAEVEEILYAQPYLRQLKRDHRPGEDV